MSALDGRIRRVVAVACGPVAVAALSGCAALGGDVASRVVEGGDGRPSPGGQAVREVDAAAVRVGDCLLEPIPQTDDEIESLMTISCLERHAEEVYAAVRLTGDEFPGVDTVGVSASTECMERFEEYVGLPYSESVLEFGFLTPTEESWDLGDRFVQCTVYHPDGERLTGSVRNGHDPSHELRDSDTGHVIEETEVDWLKIKPGDCVKESSELGDGYYETLLPCTEPHAEEVYAAFELSGDEYVGDDEVERLATEGCIERFDEFVGQAYADSPLDFYYFAPYEESWKGGDRLVQCRIIDPAGDVTGSLRGTGIQST